MKTRGLLIFSIFFHPPLPRQTPSRWRRGAKICSFSSLYTFTGKLVYDAAPSCLPLLGHWWPSLVCSDSVLLQPVVIETVKPSTWNNTQRQGKSSKPIFLIWRHSRLRFQLKKLLFLINSSEIIGIVTYMELKQIFSSCSNFRTRINF